MNIIAQLEAEQVADVVAQRAVPDFDAGDTGDREREGQRRRTHPRAGL